MTCKYFWGKFKDPIYTQEILIIAVEQDSSRHNCDIIGSDECYNEDEFIFLQEIELYNEPSREESIR